MLTTARWKAFAFESNDLTGFFINKRQRTDQKEIISGEENENLQQYH